MGRFVEAPAPTPACSTTAARRPLLPILGDRRFSIARWGFFLFLSGIMVWHNLFTRSWGIGTFPSITRFSRLRAFNFKPIEMRILLNITVLACFARNILQRKDYGADSYSPVIDADGRPSFLRYARTPAGRVLHILPAGLWSVIAPLQLIPTFRTKYRTAHRLLGRLFIVMSVSIAIGVVPIITSGATMLYQVFTKVMMLILTACFLGAGLLSVHHARNKRIAQHRVWMLRHLGMGYSVHLLRVLGPLTFKVLPALIPGYTDHTPEGFRLRSIVFGSYFLVSVVLSVGSIELWLHHASPSRAVLGMASKKKTT